jgi:hypothetical protein
MALSSDLKSNYDAVLVDLEGQCTQIHQQLVPLQTRLKELHHAIATLKSINPDAHPSVISARPINQKYANISVRWAILDLLADSEPMSSSEIADALMASGVQTKAVNFANNVSAVLTTSMKGHQEVEQLPDGKWRLTPNGISAIEHIRTMPKFLRGCGVWAKPRKF